ncbi:3-methyl-2-oxobutanoate hydroxymethyltransferase [Prochlorococcus sp. MIT 1341]|uniref:3-methyl-2-oxobutanoate hydroxymethyltransferase n=1 Tax=Prochlorococcus sp. MIT 1341 TaxID=3096221 RepID=UPI002A749D19|nr:3-methyl-2-oxobutanoate hydroxymethyltransferase [Prochlorococcus sp. MIT 1341]
MRPGELIDFKKKGRAITVLTAWDSISSSIVEASGADVVLVGDSLAMTVLGHATTLPVTLEEMLHHVKAVGRGFNSPLKNQPLVICDLPFLSYQCGQDEAVAAAGKLLKHSCAAAVKVEGAEPEVLIVIERLVRMGIPVMGHLGLTPQSVHKTGYQQQAIDPSSQERLVKQANQLQDSGCFSLVIEHVPGALASRIRALLKIPVIGIGAGEDCDGQIRVTADLLGLTSTQPPFSPSLVPGRQIFIDSLQAWVQQQHQQAENPTTTESQPRSDY